MKLLTPLQHGMEGIIKIKLYKVAHFLAMTLFKMVSIYGNYHLLQRKQVIKLTKLATSPNYNLT